MTILSRVQHLKSLIASYTPPGQTPVTLMAVTKQQPPAAIREAFSAGITDFGESYWQEAQKKLSELADLPICWHFIGHVQSNKADLIANPFSWVHSIDALKTAEKLSRARNPSLGPLQICLQVNLDNETSKAGINPKNIFELAQAVNLLPNIVLRGLMAIPEPGKSDLAIDDPYYFNSFLRLNKLLHSMNQQLALSMDTLSMGMSQDWLAAVQAGSTMLRIGQAIFGART